MVCGLLGYYSIMRVRLPLFALFVAIVAVCRGQVPPPTSRYFLHAQKEPRNGFSLVPTVTLPQTVVVMTPDDDLLALIPQPDTEWVLKRVSGWQTRSPQEQTLKLGKDSFQTPDRYTHADLTVRGDGRYVVVRITSQEGDVQAAVRDWTSVVFVIDLTTYMIASRQNTSEPSIAGGQWNFGKDGLLVSTGLANRATAKAPGLTTVTDTYEASTFELPGLASVDTCRYDSTLILKNSGNGWEQQPREKPTQGCAEILKTAGVATVDDLPGIPKTLSRVGKHLNFPCAIADVSKSQKYALYGCVTSHPTWLDTQKLTARSVTVVSIPDDKPVFSMRLQAAGQGSTWRCRREGIPASAARWCQARKLPSAVVMFFGGRLRKFLGLMDRVPERAP